MTFPSKTVAAPRPQGDLGLQFAVNVDGALRVLWLSRRTTTKGRVYQTPEDIRLGFPVGPLVAQLLEGAKLSERDDEIFQSVASAKVDRLEMRRSDTDSETDSAYAFGLEIALQYGESDESTLRLWIILGKKNSEPYFGLKLRLGNPDDPLEIDVEVGETGFFASLKQSEEAQSFNLASLGRVLSPELETLMGAIEIKPKLMALGSHKPSGNYMLAFQLEGNISLEKLPFVGERLPKSANLGISNLGLVWCSANLSNNDPLASAARTAFQNKFNDINLINPEKEDSRSDETSSMDERLDPLTSGGLFSAELQLPSRPDTPIPLQIPLRSPAPAPGTQPEKLQSSGTAQSKKGKKSKTKTGKKANGTTSETAIAPSEPVTPTLPVETGASDTGPTKWFDVNKTVGPLVLSRLGLRYADQRVWFLFDTALSGGAVTLILDGLGAGLNPFDLLSGRFDPAFTLRGLGLEIKGPAEISGAFLRDRITDPRGDYDEFSGVVLIKTEALTISGMGSYADPPWSDPSLFAYAFLDKPIGGPPFFFVTGLALGIAVNRNLDLPPIDQVSDFPLVRLALGQDLFPPRTRKPKVRDTGGDNELAELLAVQQAMKPYTRPSSGRVALAVGVRFTTFKVLNSFALLVASFGKPFKLDLLISSRLEVPALPPKGPPPPTLAQIGIDLRGTWIPEKGTILVEGRITEGSWYLDSACRLSGGAAFAAWTAGRYKGDFVVTVGGYHPQFLVPTHYPQVPRLAINFNRGPIEIKGETYFAMTPAALMVGGALSATFAQGKFKAWFNCGADFLVAWEPFSYDARMYIEVGASYRTWMGTVRASVGAQLHLWGPDLAGIATVDLRVVKFDIKFGNNKHAPQAHTPKEFQERFLPETTADLLSIGVSTGLLREVTDSPVPVFVVDPDEFSLAIESVIPQPDGEKIGIGPMGKTALSEHKLFSIKVNGISLDETDNLELEPIEKPVPAALWQPAAKDQEPRLPSLRNKAPVIDATVGYTLKPKQVATPTTTTKAYKEQDFNANREDWGNDNAAWPSERPSCLIQTDQANNRSPRDEQADGNDPKAILIKISDHPPTELVEFLTGKSVTDPGNLSDDVDWLDDLQAMPQVVTLSS